MGLMAIKAPVPVRRHLVCPGLRRAFARITSDYHPRGRVAWTPPFTRVATSPSTDSLPFCSARPAFFRDPANPSQICPT